MKTKLIVLGAILLGSFSLALLAVSDYKGTMLKFKKTVADSCHPDILDDDELRALNKKAIQEIRRQSLYPDTMEDVKAAAARVDLIADDEVMFLERRQLIGADAIKSTYRNYIEKAEQRLKATGSLRYPTERLEKKDLQFELGKDYAYITGHFDTAWKSGDNPDVVESDQGRFTEIFERKDCIWRRTHWHASHQAPGTLQEPLAYVNDYTEGLHDPTLRGTWSENDVPVIIASNSHASFFVGPLKGQSFAYFFDNREKKMFLIPQDAPEESMNLEFAKENTTYVLDFKEFNSKNLHFEINVDEQVFVVQLTRASY